MTKCVLNYSFGSSTPTKPITIHLAKGAQGEMREEKHEKKKRDVRLIIS